MRVFPRGYHEGWPLAGPAAPRPRLWPTAAGEQGDCTPCVLSPDRKDHGIWLLKDGRAELVHIDICAPVMHGKNGEDGTIEGLFELARIPMWAAACWAAPSAWIRPSPTPDGRRRGPPLQVGRPPTAPIWS